jgi:GNAT superfamily N-acetyltransferase
MRTVQVTNAAHYSAIETLRDGSMVEIRAYRPEDRADFLAAVGRVGPRSRYLRFFTLKHDFTEKEASFFLNVDFDRHVAILALMKEAEQALIVGGGRYVAIQDEMAEVAFVVLDQFQRRGIGLILLRHLASIARAAGLRGLVAEVLPENAPMLKAFKKCGIPMKTSRDSEIVHVTLQLR